MKLRFRIDRPCNDERKEHEEEIETLTKQIFDKCPLLTHVPYGRFVVTIRCGERGVKFVGISVHEFGTSYVDGEAQRASSGARSRPAGVASLWSSGLGSVRKRNSAFNRLEAQAQEGNQCEQDSCCDRTFSKCKSRNKYPKQFDRKADPESESEELAICQRLAHALLAMRASLYLSKRVDSLGKEGNILVAVGAFHGRAS